MHRACPVQSGVSSKPITVRQLWLRLFYGFMIFQSLIVFFGIFMASGGASLGEVATQKLSAIRPMFQSISAVGVVACMVIARAKLHPDSLKSLDELFRFTTLCLIVGEITVLLSAVGLAKMFLGQFLVTAILVYIVNFAIVLPSGLRVLDQPVEKVENPRNKFEV